MKNLLTFFSLFLFSFSIVKAQVPEMTDSTNTVLGMLLLPEMKLMDYPSIEEGILDTWDLEQDDIDGNDQTISFLSDGITYLIAMIPAPVPGEQLETAVEYSYLWKDARSALNNQSHIAIAVVGEKTPLELNIAFTKITAILLENSDATGVYLNNQTLVLSKEFYLQEAATMDEEQLPLYLWIYFGLRPGDEGNSAYTYGLKEFGLKEIEVVNSENSMDEVVAFIYSASQYVLAGNLELNDGETIGFSEEQKINITLSNGVNLDGETFKLAY
ncbi:MAG: DUF4261 domain-containing protein [Bacteroidota bacterium]